jgi:hypothetical protein
MTRDQDYIIRFLQGLNDDDSSIRSQILVKDMLPPLNRVFSLILQYERQNGLLPEDDTQVFVNMSRSKKEYSKGKGASASAGKGYRDRLCDYCQKQGHTEDVCYKKYGYPSKL